MRESIADVKYITLQEAAKLLPGRPHVNTVRRWCDRGYNGIVLQSKRCGRRRLTSIPYIDAFITATTGEQSPNPESTVSHTEAERALDAMGV